MFQLLQIHQTSSLYINPPIHYSTSHNEPIMPPPALSGGSITKEEAVEYLSNHHLTPTLTAVESRIGGDATTGLCNRVVRCERELGPLERLSQSTPIDPSKGDADIIAQLEKNERRFLSDTGGASSGLSCL